MASGASDSVSLSLSGWYREIADGPQSVASDLARRLCNIVRHSEDLLGLLVEKNVIVAEVASAHVPVEILRLNVECEHIGQQSTQRGSDLDNSFTVEAKCSFVRCIGFFWLEP